MIKNYIWDFDGTLYDTYPIMLKAIMQTLTEMQVSADETAIYRTLKEYSSKKITEDLKLPYGPFSDRFHELEAQSAEVPRSFLGTKDTLATLQSRGGRHFIMTHRPVPSTIDLLQVENLLGYFEEIVGPENQFPRKPDPSAINYIVEKHQLILEETVMIGDRLLDVEAGKGAGIKTCFFDVDGFLTNISADFVAHSMAEISEIH